MKILYVTTVSGTINAFLIPHIQILLDQGHHVDIACNVQSKIDISLINQGCKVFDIEFQRSPIKKENYWAYKKLIRIIQDQGYDIVHTHTPVASVCVRIACRKMKNITVLYTAHGFHFFKGAPIINWLIYYPIEKWLSRYTDVLITINNEDYQRAKKLFRTSKVEYIPGIGLDTKKFINVIIDKSTKRRELGLPEDAFVALSVGELNKNKNHETVIRALAKINNVKSYFIICGQGPLENYLSGLANRLGVGNQVKLLGFRNDISEIYKSADVFVFPSFREGLPVSLMEAMAAGVPVVCSDIRGNRDLIEDGQGGYWVDSEDVDGYANSINRVLNNPSLREQMCAHNLSIIKEFDIENVLSKMIDIYNKI